MTIELVDGRPSPSVNPQIEALANLREFLRQAEANGDLQTVSGATAEAEIGGLFDLSNKIPDQPVLLFDRIPGYDSRFRVIVNVHTAKVLVGELSLEALKAYRQQAKLGKPEPIAPEVVGTGAVFENAIEGDAVDVRAFPAPTWHADDGGPNIGTGCVIVQRDADTGCVNLGTYRVMVQDAKTLGIFIDSGKDGDIIRRKYWDQGKSCPIAISVGQAPILGQVGALALIPGLSEYDVAGGRIGRPVRVVHGKVTGLPIPADAELVFEGYMPPLEEDARMEGPFGEWPGYYASGARLDAVVHVKAIYHRDDLMIVGQAPLSPTYPGEKFRISRLAAIWDALEAAGVPNVKGVWKMLGGGSNFINVIAIEQSFAGHAKMAGLVASGIRDIANMTRINIVVDDDIDIENPAQVVWALATRWDPKTQLDIIDGCWSSTLDPALSPEKRAAGDITTSRAIIYAVKPYHWKDQFPKPYGITRSAEDALRLKWKDTLPFLRE